jgi:glutamate synthase (NADPH/NADH) large chain
LQGIDLSKLLHQVQPGGHDSLNWSGTQDHGLEAALDQDLIKASAALESGQAVRIERNVINVNRTVGAMLSGEVARKYGHARVCPTTPSTSRSPVSPARASARFLAHGITLDLTGDANDYVGKGLSGGRVIVRPPATSKRDPPRTSSSATPCFMARSRARPISTALPANASPCAIQAPSRWSKAPATMAANT